MARLVITTPPAGFTAKPSASNAVDPSTTFKLSSYKTIAEKSPNQTSAWVVSWSATASKDDSANIAVSLLPDAAAAETVQTQAVKVLLGADSGLKTTGYVYHSAVDVPGVPGAAGALYTATGTATTPPEAIVAYRDGQAQVLVLLAQVGTPAAVASAAAHMAANEYVYINQALHGFSLATTRVPLVATIVYWVVAAALLGLAFGIPLGVRRVRRRREELRQRTARRQQNVRGSKIARRQASRRR